MTGRLIPVSPGPSVVLTPEFFQMRTAHLFMAAVTVLLISCASSPSLDETRRLAEGNRWELVRWGDRTVPHGDNGEPVILEFKGGRASGHAGCNRYSTRVTFGPGERQVTVSPGMTTRMACEPRRMEFETAFIRAFEASTDYRVEGNRLMFEGSAAPPMEFYRRPSNPESRHRSRRAIRRSNCRTVA